MDSTEMPNINVTVYDSTENKRVPVELPDEAPCNKIVAVLVQKCRLLVIGAGALGNEILKNAALLGFTQVVVVDLDCIEESNLSRAVLYRSDDVGKFKADAAASAYKSLAPDATVHSLVANVVHGCGLGLFEWSDMIVAGLDNREARLWINRSAWKMNRPWVDGGIGGMNGVVRGFSAGVGAF